MNSELVELGAKELSYRSLILTAGDIVVACEGLDDAFVVKALVSSQGLAAAPFRIVFSNSGSLTAQGFLGLIAQAVLNRAKAIALVVDAEEDRAVILEKWKASLVDAGIRLEGDLPGIGTLRSQTPQGELLFGLHINPSGHEKGSLESLFLEQIPATAVHCFDQARTCLEESGVLPRQNTAQLAKWKVRNYLLMHNASNTGLNVALQRNVLKADGPGFADIAAFIQDLSIRQN